VFSLYRVVLFLHIAVVVFIIGPLAVSSVLASKSVTEGQEGVKGLENSLRTFRLYGALSVLAPLLGAAMIGLGNEGKAWAWGQTWIGISLTVYLIAVADVFFVLVPSTKKALAEVTGGRSAELLQGRIQAAGGVAMLCWTIIILLMVFRPGGHGS
jgi:hypothetical protein